MIRFIVENDFLNWHEPFSYRDCIIPRAAPKDPGYEDAPKAGDHRNWHMARNMRHAITQSARGPAEIA
jgi:hypothetical protein